MESPNFSSKLETIFFSTLDALRGLWDPENARNTLLSILFQKRIAQLSKEGLIELSKLRTADFQCWTIFANELVNDASRAVENLIDNLRMCSQRNPTLEGIFQPIEDALKEEDNPQLLLQFLLLMEEIDFSSKAISIEDFGLFFNESLYRASVSAGYEAQKHTTPPHINQLIVALCSPKGGELIYDPTAGHGSTLVSFIHQLPNVDILASEIHSINWALCRMNLLVNGAYHARVFCQNALLESNEKNLKVDFAVAHFPFGQYIETNLIKDQPFLSIPFDINTPQLNDKHLFVQKMFDKLNAVGKMLCLMPIHFLVNDGVDKKLREFLIRRDLIESVIALPYGLLNNSSIPICILVINKNKAIDRKEHIVFVNGANLNINGKTKLNRELSTKQVESVSMAYHQLKNDSNSGLKDCVEKVSLHQIILNDYNLDAKRYASPFISELRALDRKGALIQLKNIFETDQPALWFDNAFQDIPYIRPQNLGDSLSNYLVDTTSCALTSSVKQVAGQLIRDNRLLVKRSGKKFKASYFVYEQNPVLVNEDIMTFRIDEDKVLPEYLLMMLYDDLFLQQLNMYKSDYKSKAILEEQFEALQINLPALETQHKKIVDCKKKLLIEEENKVEKLRADLNLGKQRAQSEQYKIISSLQHELGNKLPAVLMEFKNLKDYLHDKQEDESPVKLDDPLVPLLEGEDNEQTDLLSASLERMENMLKHAISSLDATSDIIKADRTKLNLEPCNLLQFLEEISLLYQNHAFKIYIETEEDAYGKAIPVIARIDRSQMTSVISNLIENAIRHGFVEKHKRYSILFRLAYSNDKQEVILQYKNDGQGFPDNFSFSDFISYGNYAGHTGHSGIGGYLIHQIIDNHNGQISYQSINDGRDPFKIQFEITLPI